MTKDILYFIERFNLVQSVSSPTQQHGHTLDLVLFFWFACLNSWELWHSIFWPCLYCLILLLPVTQLHLALLLSPVASTLPLLFSLHPFSVRTMLYQSLYVIIQRSLAHGCTLPSKLLWILELLWKSDAMAKRHGSYCQTWVPYNWVQMGKGQFARVVSNTKGLLA